MFASTYQTLLVTETTQNYYLTTCQPYALWAVSLAEVKRGVFERDVAGVEKAGTDVIRRSKHRRSRMSMLITLHICVAVLYRLVITKQPVQSFEMPRILYM